MVHVTAFFAGILGFLFIALSANVIKSRRKMRVSIGDGGDAQIARKMRAHANFAEYTPFVLLLMGINEMNGTSHTILVAIGMAFLLGRLSHAYGLLVAEVASTSDKRFNFRMVGMVCTFTVIAVLSLMAVF